MNTAFLQAYKCLDNVFRKGSYSGIELNNTLGSALPKDKPLITKLVYGVLDRNIELEYDIKQFAVKVKPSIFTVLKIGLYCLAYLSIPPYAVINDCVELTKNIGKKELSGFVNATLRKLSENIGKFALPENYEENLSIKYSFPLWCVKKLIKQRGKEFTESFLSYTPNNETHIRINTNAITVADFCALMDKKGVKYENSFLPDGLRIFGALPRLDKLATPMSTGSMLVSLALNTTSAEKILDVCAAPGGKSVYIATKNPKANVTACDVYPHRVELIKSYASRMKVKNVTAVLSDATVFNPDYENAFDSVLCDAPCSGMGVFYSKPDIKLFREEIAIKELSDLQKTILSNAAKYVKNGGELVYITCTVFDEENVNVINKFLAEHSEFSLCEFTLPRFGKIDGMKQFFPHIDGVEGYFIAKMIKRK